MDDRTQLIWCNRCQRVLEKQKIVGLHKLLSDVPRPHRTSRSFGEEVEQLQCGYCGARGLGYGELQEVANIPKLSLLIVLLGVGFLGRSMGNEFLQWMGFGIPAANAAYGLFLKNNLRWIFTTWVVVPEPDWYARKMEVYTASLGFAFLHANGGSLLAIVLISVAAIVDATKEASPTPPAATAAAATGPAVAPLFRDDTNQYFSILPPKTWKFERTDDSRTKVTWRHPVESDVLLRVTARTATEDMAQVQRDTRNTTTDYNRMGLKSVLAEQHLGDYQTVVVDQWPRPARSRIVLFIAGNVHFNVQYAAPSESSFREHEAKAVRAIETLSPMPGKASGGADAVRREELAWYRRYAVLLSKIGETDASKALATEGAVKYPGDAELNRLAGSGHP